MGAVPLHLRVMPDPQHSVFHLIENWEHDSGMIAAFTHLPPLLILHLDRLKPMAGLTYGQKLTSKVHLDSKFQVPQFRGDGIPTLHHDYVIVAAVAHLGQPGAGHYRAALRRGKGTSTSEWLLSDDGCRPTPVKKLPGWFESQVCLAWAIRVADACKLWVDFGSLPHSDFDISGVLRLFAD